MMWTALAIRLFVAVKRTVSVIFKAVKLAVGCGGAGSWSAAAVANPGWRCFDLSELVEDARKDTKPEQFKVFVLATMAGLRRR